MVATYNVRNYTAADRMTPEGFRPDFPKPEPEKQALRAVIRAINADILALQEMGPKPYLDELRRDLKAEGLDYPYAVLLEADDPDRHVALLAKTAPRKVTLHAALRIRYFKEPDVVKRGLLEAVFAADGGDVTVFALHLKSRLTERPDDPLSAIRREAEATAVRDLVLARFPDPETARFLVVGDCNDGPGSKPLDRLLRRGATAIAAMVPATDSRDERWTYYYAAEDSYARVDHILVSGGLQSAVRKPGARIFDGPAAKSASDHRAVYTTLDL